MLHYWATKHIPSALSEAQANTLLEQAAILTVVMTWVKVLNNEGLNPQSLMLLSNNSCLFYVC